MTLEIPARFARYQHGRIPARDSVGIDYEMIQQIIMDASMKISLRVAAGPAVFFADNLDGVVRAEADPPSLRTFGATRVAPRTLLFEAGRFVFTLTG